MIKRHFYHTIPITRCFNVAILFHQTVLRWIPVNSICKGSTQPCPCNKINYYFFIQAYHFTFTNTKHHCIYIIQKVVDTSGEKRGGHVKANQITVTTWDGDFM